MAEALAMTPAAYNYVEKGTNSLSGRVLSLLQYVYKVRPEYILDGEGDMFEMRKPLKPPPLYTMRTLYLIDKFLKEEGMTIHEFAKQSNIKHTELDECFRQQSMPDHILDKICEAHPKLAAIIARDRENTQDNAALQRKISELEEELERSRKIIDRLVAGGGEEKSKS